MNFTIYEVGTGRIERCIQCPEEIIGLQFNPETHAVAHGHHDDEAVYFHEGSAVPKPPRPSPTHAFNYTTKQWEDPRTLADLKAAKNAAINAARLKANQAHFTFMGEQIAVDALSRSDIDAAHGAWLLAGGPPPGWPGGWKAISNAIIPITDMATWGQFYGAMVAQGTANFMHAQALKAQLAAATTPEEVEAVPVW